MDPNYRQKAAAEYLGVSVRQFRTYAIRPDYLPSSGSKPIKVWPASRLDAFKKSFNDALSRSPALKRRTA